MPMCVLTANSLTGHLLNVLSCQLGYPLSQPPNLRDEQDVVYEGPIIDI